MTDLSYNRRMIDDKGGREERNRRIFNLLNKQPNISERYVGRREINQSFEQKIKNEEGRLKNKALEQDIVLKKETLSKLFYLLVGETITIFIIAFFQGWKLLDFGLEGWSFEILVVATIMQITAMLLVAVKHLFPQKSD